MHILSITLKKCRYITLGLHDSITYVPSAIEQVILGTNGSGKSSLLRQIYNIVPSGDMFFTGGGQEHISSHNGKVFKATSMFETKAGHHSFCISDDGESWVELNDSGLQTDQKTLVEKYLGLDQDLVDLMVGSTRLSRMDPKTRRNWLMRICGTDFEYINGLHQTLKKRHRDFKGTIDTLSESLADTLKDLGAIATDAVDQSMELEDLQILANNVSGKLEEIGSTSNNVKLLRSEIANHVEGLQIDSSNIARHLKMRNESFKNLSTEKLRELRQFEDAHGFQLEGHQKALCARLKDVLLAIDAVGRDNLKEPSLVLQKLASITEEISSFKPDVVNVSLSLEEVVHAKNTTELAIRRLQPILADMPFVEDLTAMREEARTAMGRQQEISVRLVEINKRIQTLAVRIEHWEHTDDVDCPQCKTRFKPGMDDRLASDFKIKIGQLREEEMKLLAESAQLGQTLETYETVRTVIHRYREVVDQHQSIDKMWKHIDDARWLFKSPTRIIPALSKYLMQLEDQQHYLRLAGEQEKLLNIKASLEGDTGQLLETAEMLEDELHDLGVQWSTSKATEKKYAEDIALYDSCCKLVARFNSRFVQYVNAVKELHAATLSEALKSTRVKANTRIGVLHTLQSRYKALVEREVVIRDQINEAKQKFEVFKLLDKATSPTEGVVAEVIKSFMDFFLAHLNDHLAQVWSHDLILSEMPDKGQAFTCQLSMQVAGSAPSSDDFKTGSTGQVSMIDFAFKLVVYTLLGLKDMPLLADEFGKDFDDEHRGRLIYYIKGMLEDKKYSQLFMISHYSSVYSTFENAEIVVLHDSNITKPSVYNTGISFR